MKIHLRTHGPVDAYLTPTDVLQRLRVNARTLYRLMGEGHLPAVRIGRQWRVRPSDFDLWVRRQSTAAGATTEPEVASSARGQHHGITTTARPATESGI